MIGDPEHALDEECAHLTMRAWPSILPPEYIHPTEINKKIEYWEENHCKQSNPLGITKVLLATVKKIDVDSDKYSLDDASAEQLIDYMMKLKMIIDCCTPVQLDYLFQNYPGFHRFAKSLKLLALGVSGRGIELLR